MRKIRLHALAEISLASNPELGVRRDNVREGYRALFVNRHAIYYKLTPSMVEIVRVLHGQMEVMVD